jgi:hypothetical protein
VVPGGVVGNFGDVLDYYDLASDRHCPHEYEMLKTGQDERRRSSLGARTDGAAFC